MELSPISLAWKTWKEPSQLGRSCSCPRTSAVCTAPRLAAVTFCSSSEISADSSCWWHCMSTLVSRMESRTGGAQVHGVSIMLQPSLLHSPGLYTGICVSTQSKFFMTLTTTLDGFALVSVPGPHLPLQVSAKSRKDSDPGRWTRVTPSCRRPIVDDASPASLSLCGSVGIQAGAGRL